MPLCSIYGANEGRAYEQINRILSKAVLAAEERNCVLVGLHDGESAAGKHKAALGGSRAHWLEHAAGNACGFLDLVEIILGVTIRGA
jgi:hypothetical protein